MNYNARMRPASVRGQVLALVLLVLFLSVGGCSTAPEPPAKIYRCIDHLNQSNIIRTPLEMLSENQEIPSHHYPLKSSPMLDAGVGENPLLLKRKLRLGGAERNAIFSPPDSEYTFTVSLTKDSVFEFGFGIIRDESSELLAASLEGNSRGVNFIITLEIEGRKKTVFQQYLPPPELQNGQGFSFIRQSVELPYQMEDAVLTLRTQGDQPHFSFWTNPILYPQQRISHNVILISVDTLRADHLGCYGYERDTSPNIDALAEDSFVFLNTYASSPWTLPSHVSMLTSLHGVRHQVYHEDERMDPSLITLADIFRKNQFMCAAFTGGGFVSAAYGFSKGFDSYNEGVGGVFHQNSAERVFRAVSDWIDRQLERDFFLFIHTYQPHSPYACPPPYKVMFLNEHSQFGHVDLIQHIGGKEGIFRPLPDAERQNIVDLYDGEIRYTDEKLIGPLINKLKSTGLYDRTLIIFTSDHGEEFYDHGGWGHGHSLYDESLRVPLILKFPKADFQGRRADTVVSLIDIMPTAIEVMGLNASELEIDGRSLMPIIKSKEEKDRVFIADIGSNVLDSHIPQRIATNRERYKLILSQAYTPEDYDFFAHPPPGIGPVELYDLKNDFREDSNIANNHPQLANDIIRWLNDYYAQVKKMQTGKAQIDQAVREQLKALGYIK